MLRKLRQIQLFVAEWRKDEEEEAQEERRKRERQGCHNLRKIAKKKVGGSRQGMAETCGGCEGWRG